MQCFGDSFDLYAAASDLLQNYWDGGSSGSIQLGAGRFTGSRAIGVGSTNGVQEVLFKNGNNDAVHHIVCSVMQAGAVSGTNILWYFTFRDGTNSQCSVGFRQDGAILLTSGSISGSTLATYTGAVTAQNAWTAFEIEVVI